MSMYSTEQYSGQLSENKAAMAIIDRSKDRPVFSRRQFVAGVGALSALALSADSSAKIPKVSSRFLLSANGDSADKYSVAWLKADGQRLLKASLGFRGHGAVKHPCKSASVVMFSRSPGTKGVEVNLENGAIDGLFSCRPGRHLAGHGCFSGDGSILYTTESDYHRGVGKIGIRDARSYQWLGEYASYGVGPHDIRLMPDRKTLVVANGGILTHPSSGRKKLNLATMASTLTYIDTATGNKVGAYQLSEPKASIRHLDVLDDDTVVFAAQFQRPAVNHQETVSLAGVHRTGYGLTVFDDSPAVINHLNDYLGSVAVSSKTRVAGFTSPRGNLAAFWNIDSRQLVGYHRLTDVCGIALNSEQDKFTLSNSSGQLRQLDASSLREDVAERKVFSSMQWDNHLLSIN